MIKIIIADDHKLFALGLASILNNDDEIIIEAIFNDGRSAISYLKNNAADIILLDLNMPFFDGFNTIEEIKNQGIVSKIMVISMYAEDAIIKKCLDAGVSAFLLKDTEPDLLIKYIKEVYTGEGQIINQKPFDQNITFKDDFITKHRLSTREVEIVKLLVNGFSTPKISKHLSLSPFTIDTHRKNILSKFGLKSTAELVKIAVEQNI